MKIGSIVKATKEVDGKSSIRFEIGRVIYVGKRVLVEFFKNVCGHDGNGVGKKRHCWMCDWEAVSEVEKGE